MATWWRELPRSDIIYQNNVSQSVSSHEQLHLPCQALAPELVDWGTGFPRIKKMYQMRPNETPTSTISILFG